MNAGANRRGTPTTIAEPASTDASAETAVDASASTVGPEAQPTVAVPASGVPAALGSANVARSDSTGKQVPVASAWAQIRRRNQTIPNPTKLAVGAAPMVTLSTSPRAAASSGRAPTRRCSSPRRATGCRCAPTTPRSARTTPTCGRGWRNWNGSSNRQSKANLESANKPINQLQKL